MTGCSVIKTYSASIGKLKKIKNYVLNKE